MLCTYVTKLAMSGTWKGNTSVPVIGSITSLRNEVTNQSGISRFRLALGHTWCTKQGRGFTVDGKGRHLPGRMRRTTPRIVAPMPDPAGSGPPTPTGL
jgi:hypothetical protein